MPGTSIILGRESLYGVGSSGMVYPGVYSPVQAGVPVDSFSMFSSAFGGGALVSGLSLDYASGSQSNGAATGAYASAGSAYSNALIYSNALVLPSSPALGGERVGFGVDVTHRTAWDEVLSGAMYSSRHGSLFMKAWEEFNSKNAISINNSEIVRKDRILSWRDQLYVEVGKYAEKPEGWDGYDAKPISPSCIADAQHFIEYLPEYLTPPLDQPCADGEVSFVWRSGNYFAEVGFPGDGTFYWYATNGAVHGSDDNVLLRRGLPFKLREIMNMRRIPNGKTETSLPPLEYSTLMLARAA